MPPSVQIEQQEKEEEQQTQGIAGVIWDLDGTLLDTEQLSSQGIQEVVGPLGATFDWETKKKILGTRAETWTRIVIQDLGLEGKITPLEMEKQWEEHLHKLTPGVVKCKGAERLTKELHARGVPQGIATSCSQGSMTIKRGPHEDMFGLMRCIVTGDDPAVLKGKPSPDIYILAAQRMGLEPKQCLVFEDALSGVQAAAAAGMRVVAVPDQRLDSETFMAAGASLVLGSLDDFDASAVAFSPLSQCLVNGNGTATGNDSG